MKKKEAMELIRKRRGFVPYVAMFETYCDDDEIPAELIERECVRDRPNADFIVCGAALAAKLKN